MIGDILFCIIIPFFNEEDNILPLVKEVEKVIRKNNLNIDVVTVNDGSTDSTLSKLQEMAVRFDNIYIVTYEENRGMGGALKAGITFALGTYAAILFMDGDLSHDPNTIPEFIASISAYDVVIGSRYVRGGGMENVPFSRRFISKMGNMIMKIILGVSISDITTGYRMVRTDVLKQITLQRDDFMIQVEMIAKARTRNMTEIPILLRNRKAGTSKFRISLKVLLSYVIFALRMRVTQ